MVTYSYKTIALLHDFFSVVFLCKIFFPWLKFCSNFFWYLPNLPLKNLMVHTLWFPCLDGLIQTLGNVARVKKSAQNHSPSARVARFSYLSQHSRVFGSGHPNTETINCIILHVETMFGNIGEGLLHACISSIFWIRHQSQ
jgi:hypothetical protein